jgi:hypothetical protein
MRHTICGSISASTDARLRSGHRFTSTTTYLSATPQPRKKGPVAALTLKPMLDLAQAVVERVMGEDAVLGAAAADAGYWSEDNAASQTAECELFIATRQDRQQRAELRDAPAPRGRMPKGLSARERMQRKLRTRRGRAIYRQRGASVEPVFGQMKERQDAGRFSMRGLVACRGEWHLQAATHNLRKLHRESVRRARSATARHPNGHRTKQRTA